MTRIFLLALVSGICLNTFCQSKTEDFTITLPENKVTNSLYNKISFLDSRYDTTNMGVVQLGAFNRKALVVPETPLAEQVTKAMTGLTDATAKEGELLLQLKQFSFAELTGAMSEKGYCYLRARLYAKNSESYTRLSTLDTLILIKSLDVTKALFRNGSKVFTNFIAAALIQSPADSNIYSYYDILHIDSLEKRSIKLYNTSTYAEGLYYTFESFRDQVPDKQVTVKVKKDKITSVVKKDETGVPVKVIPQSSYALVYEGKPYIATKFGYYPLTKINDDFIFTGKAQVTANAGNVIMAGAFFGIIGTLLASDASSLFEMKLDHLSGGFVRIKEVKQ